MCERTWKERINEKVHEEKYSKRATKGRLCKLRNLERAVLTFDMFVRSRLSKTLLRHMSELPGFFHQTQVTSRVKIVPNSAALLVIDSLQTICFKKSILH